MLPALLSFRFVMLVVTLGCTAGALMMFWEGILKLEVAFLQIVHGTGAERLVIGAVMGGVDKFLFGLVLVIIAYAVAFGFVIDLAEAKWEELPGWMKVNGVAELKRTFFEVILVYLAVDFATDIASTDTHLTWETMVMPASILLLAGAMRLLTHPHEPVPLRRGRIIAPHAE